MSIFQRLLADPPPAMAFEISEAGIASAKIGPQTELDLHPIKAGSVAVSPLKDNVVDIDEFTASVRAAAGGPASKKRRDAALILPDYCTRTAVLDFDIFPSDPK